MPSKNLSYSFIKLSFLFISLFLIKIEPTLCFPQKDIEKICFNSDKYIKNYFNGDGNLPEQYSYLDQTEIEKGNNKNTIKLILLAENAEVENENATVSQLKNYQIILLLFIIIFCIIIIIFEIHFLCRISYSIKEIRKKNKINCFTFTKINPVGCCFKYPCIDQKERVKYFLEYKSQNRI